MNYVYQFVDGKEVLYIGKSDRSDFKRIREHGKNHDNIPKEARERINHADIYITLLCNSTMTDVVESELIRRYRPPYNKAKQSEWSGLDFPEIKWIPFRINGEEIYRKDLRPTFSNAENGIEKHDYFSDYMKCAEEVSKLSYKSECLNQTIKSLSSQNESLKNELQKSGEELKRVKENRDYCNSLYEEWLRIASDETFKCLDLSTKYNDLLKKWNGLVKKYNKAVAENKELKVQQSRKKTTSMWKKLFSKQKTA